MFYLWEIGVDTINPLPGEVATNDTLFDECAGSLQATTGAYGYRVMPPCLHGDISLIPEVRLENSVSSRSMVSPRRIGEISRAIRSLAAFTGVARIQQLNLMILARMNIMFLQGGGYDPALALIGFESADSAGDESSPPESPLLGFAMDGQRLYGPFDATRSLAWGLDTCNGRWEIDGLQNGITKVGKKQIYTYRATPEFPYLIGCPGPTDQRVVLEDSQKEMTTGVEYTPIDGGFLIEAQDGACPAGSFLSIDSGQCTACQAGTFGKDPGLVGQGCPGVSNLRIRSAQRASFSVSWDN